MYRIFMTNLNEPNKRIYCSTMDELRKTLNDTGYGFGLVEQDILTKRGIIEIYNTRKMNKATITYRNGKTELEKLLKKTECKETTDTKIDNAGAYICDHICKYKHIFETQSQLEDACRSCLVGHHLSLLTRKGEN